MTDHPPPPRCSFNTWNAFGGAVDEASFLRVAGVIVDSGLKDAGYEFANMDDGWSAPQRGANGSLIADPSRFPSGLPALAAAVHALGLKFGIYGDAGARTCEGLPGSRGHEAVDAATFAAAGVDYLKYDNCYAANDDFVVARYSAIREALNAAGRPVVLSLCEWGVAAPWRWAGALGHAWRTTKDVANAWEAVLSNLDASVGLARFARPGAWNDLDMLEIGNGALTAAQERAHFALWALLKSPLLIGADLRTIGAASLDILLAEEVVAAMSQDALGVAGELIWKEGPREAYAAPLADGGRAVVLFNRVAIEYRRTTISVTWAELGLPADAECAVRDLYARKDLGTFRGGVAAEVGPHDVAALRVTPLDVGVAAASAGWRPWDGQPAFAAHDAADGDPSDARAPGEPRGDGADAAGLPGAGPPAPRAPRRVGAGALWAAAAA